MNDKSLWDKARPVSECAALMTVEEFKQNVEAGGFIDYDGDGYPVKDGMEAPVLIKPSRVESIPEDATHIAWYNR